MHRFFIPNISQDKPGFLEQDQANKACRVLRLKPGSRIIVFDGKGREFFARIVELNPAGGKFVLLGPIPANREAVQVTLAQALPKKNKFEDVIDKSVQLGAGRIIPFCAERSVVRSVSGTTLTRWRKICQEAVRQSNRSVLPEISGLLSYADVLEEMGRHQLCLFGCLEKGVLPLKKVLSRPCPRSVMVLIGPEGDFTKKEIALAKAKGAVMVSMGPRVLRCETAAAAMMAIIAYEWEF